MANFKVLKQSIFNFFKKQLPKKQFEYLNLIRKKKSYTKSKVIFVHVPKAAGTSICHALYGKTLGHYKAKDLKAALSSEFDNSFTFALVRNPYDRLVSAYNFAKQGRTDVMGIANPERYQTSAFDTFEKFVHEWVKKVDLEIEDYVFQPQYLFTHSDKGEQLVKKIWKVEEIDDFYREFQNFAEQPIQRKHINKSKSHTNTILSNEVKDIIYSRYQKDFELFKYPK